MVFYILEVNDIASNFKRFYQKRCINCDRLLVYQMNRYLFAMEN